MAPTPEERVSRLEGLTDGIRDPLDQLHRDLKALEEGIDRRFEGIDQRFNATIGLTFTSWITLMMAILFK